MKHCKWCGKDGATYSAQLLGHFGEVFWFCDASCHEALLRAEEDFE